MAPARATRAAAPWLALLCSRAQRCLFETVRNFSAVDPYYSLPGPPAPRCRLDLIRPATSYSPGSLCESLRTASAPFRPRGSSLRRRPHARSPRRRAHRPGLDGRPATFPRHAARARGPHGHARARRQGARHGQGPGHAAGREDGGSAGAALGSPASPFSATTCHRLPPAASTRLPLRSRASRCRACSARRRAWRRRSSAT